MKRFVYLWLIWAALTAPMYAQGITPDANTMGLWRLDESSGTIITDASGRGHDGITGGNPLIVSGRYNNARLFNTDSVVVPDHADWNFGTNPFTIECWVNFSSNASHGIIVGQIGSVADYWRLHYEVSANKLEFVAPPNTTQYLWTPNTDQWYHIAVTKSDSIRLYINGIKVASGATGTIPNPSRPLIFGWGESSSYFKGTLDEIRISNIARSPSEFNLAPPAPGDFLASVFSTSQINLSWTPSTGGVTKYRIYRSDGIDNNFVQRDSIVNPSANSYNGTGLGTATTYYFKAASVNEFGETRSAGDSATTASAGISFTESTVGSATFGAASPINLGDYDNDGNLDIIVTGATGTTPATKIYSNQGNGTFNDEFQSSIDNVWKGGIQFGDYNNDGYLDLSVLGDNSSGNPLHKIYKGNGTSSFVFDTTLTPVTSSTNNLWTGTTWGDFNFDGKQDLLASGLLYENQGGTGHTFSRVGFLPDSVQQGMVAWCDYDRDGDLDFIYSGGIYGPWYTQLWRNDGPMFTHITALDAVFPQVGEGAVAWGDYNNDGRPDLAICGVEGSNRHAKIFKNNGNDQFADINAGLIPLYGQLAWGDFDNDGYLDLIAFGSDTQASYALSVYRNNRDNTFTNLGRAGVNTVSFGTVVTGDYDRDGRMDLVMVGTASNNAEQPVVLCRNTSLISANVKPVAPLIRNTIPGGDSVRISWNQVTGDETPSNGLTYNIRMGTSPEGINRVSPMANVSTGLRRVSRQGNAWHDTAVVVRNLANGTYYWAVQAIDNSFEGGLFSAEQSFSIGVPPNTPGGLSAQALGSSQVSLSWTAGAGTITRYRIFRGTSPNPTTQVDSVTSTSATNTVSAAGVFYYRITAVNDNGYSSYSNGVSLLVNSSPVWADVSGKIIVTTVEDSAINISFDPLVADPDHADSVLRFVVLSSSNGTAVLDTNTHILTFTPSSNFSGIGTANLRVYDPFGGSDTTQFELTIQPRNDPVVKAAALRDTSLQEDFGYKKFISKLSNFFSDVDDATLNYTFIDLNPGKVIVSKSADTLYVTSVQDSNGNVDIRIVASDGTFSVSDTLRLTITPANDPPSVSQFLRDTTLAEDFGTKKFISKLSNFFSDVDNATLNYTPFILNSGKVTALVSSDTLYVTSVQDSNGNVDIRIVASDGTFSVSDTLRLTITPANDSPSVSQFLRDTILAEDFGTKKFISKLSTFFSDVDNATLTYTPFVLNSGKVTALVSSDTLYVTSVQDSNGNVDIRIVASDGTFSASDTLRLTINPVNDKPRSLNTLPDSLILSKNFVRRTVATLTAHFDDVEDGSALTYSATALDGKLSASVVSGNVLQLDSIHNQTGDALRVRIQALDAGGDSVADTIRVSVRDISTGNFNPSLPQFSTAASNSPVPISFSTSANLTSVEIFYKEGGKDSFSSVAMALSSGTWSGEIPQSVIGSRGTSYYLRLSDGVNVLYSPAGAPANVHNIKVTVANAQALETQPNGNTQSAYRMISFPFELSNNNITDLLSAFGIPDDVGLGYAIYDWIGQNYVKMSNTGFRNPEAGRGYMFITSAPSKYLTITNATTTRTDTVSTISLPNNDWTMIGNPFNFAVDWADVINNSSVGQPKTYDGSDFQAVQTLEPWKGYFVKNSSNQPVQIKIPAKAGAGFGKIMKAGAFAYNRNFDSGEWQIQIKTSAGALNDHYNYLGMLKSAETEKDADDDAESPRHPGNEFIKLYFDHSDWSAFADRYGSDFRPVQSEGEVWNFDVNALTSAESIPLHFEQIDRVPSEFEIILLDKDLNVVRDIRKEQLYSFPAKKNAIFTRHFRLVIGKNDFVSQNLDGVPLIPVKFDLSQNYPNPFNPTTGIKFSLASNSRVRLTIYNILGQEVKTLVNSNLPAGYQTVMWNGKNNFGQQVSSGLYIYRLQAEALDTKQKYVKAKKMLLVK